MAITTVMFDLGNVLVKYDYEKVLLGLSAFSNDSLSKLVNRRIQQITELTAKDELEYEAGHINTEEFYKRFTESSKMDLSKETFFSIWNSGIHSIPNSEYILDKLKLKGYTLVAASNTNEAHSRFMEENLKFMNYFHYKVYSHNLKFRKPDDIFYREALVIAGKHPEEVLFIDDKQENIDSAIVNGIQSIRHNSLETSLMKLQKHLVDSHIL